MPRLFVGVRKRELALRFAAARTQFLEEAAEHSKDSVLEYAHSILYIIGGALLIIGSVFFLPTLFDPFPLVGTYCFIVASILYFYVSFYDVVEVAWARKQEKALLHQVSDVDKGGWLKRALNAQQQRHMQELFASTSYATGAALFILGSVLFMPNVGKALAGGWCFVIGSALFLVGAFYNVLLIWDSPDKFSTHLANLIANTYVIGSSFYLCASLPYLDTQFQSTADEWIVFTGSAGVYIAGSVLFEIGGVLDLYRAQYIRNYAAPQNDSKATLGRTDEQTQTSTPFIEMNGIDDKLN